MADDLVLNLREVRSLTDALFDALSARGIEHLAVHSSRYWSVYFEDAFALDSKPELVVADLREDIEDLRRDASELSTDPSRRDVPLWHAFHHLSGLMTSLAQGDLSGQLHAASDLESGRV